MKIIENTTAYKCEFCGKTSLRRHNMESHESACRKNPKNRAMCRHCVHQFFDGEQEKITGYCYLFDGEHEDTKLFDCTKCKCTGNKMFQPYHLNEFWRTISKMRAGYLCRANLKDVRTLRSISQYGVII